ncbi:hypothetical protein KFL_006890030 [Klebsormidium nitens]|uniref:Uncharacterized protein n=1 Tax=Klebsormidium nitens TaxID=105231 RepID=A0A1Y1IRR0_KLENI|nr:hypothetical protein KFL_006890030 [Klebsormidium nitens]|eukprot:GAQ90818.1 hypothetical protein KFL_006890030 [Klebsormidium nitens]
MSSEEGLQKRQFNFPLFCGLWLPAKPGEEDAGRQLLVLGGGGGAGAHGVLNRLVLAAWDATTATLLPELAGEETGEDAAQAAAVHPQGAVLVVAFATGAPLRRYDVRSGPSPRLLSGAALPAGLQGWGEQRALAFNESGDRLALGGQDGAVRVVEWPSGRVSVQLPEAHTADVRSLAFSADGRFLASTSRSAACPVWDLHRDGEQAATLTVPQGCTISAVRFSRVGPLVAPSGALLACASAEGAIAVLAAPHLAPLLRVRRAHPLFITGLDFSPDSSALLSISADSSARVTDLRHVAHGSAWWDLLLALLVALLAVALAAFLQR